ncbi:MAG: GIN domain-containing protein [Legionella sp.]
MQKRCYLVFLIVSLFVGCVHRAPPTPPPPAAKIKQSRQLAAFNQVEVQGQINVNLHTGYKQPQVILSGDARDLAAVKTEVLHNTLVLTLGKGYPIHGPVYAEVQGQFLNLLLAKDTSSITGKQLNTRILDVYLVNTGSVQLDGSIGLRVLDVKGKGLVQIGGLASSNLQLHLQGSPKIQLAGVANLARLTMEGNAWLSLFWVKTDTLTVRAKSKSTIQLAGAVNRLDVELWGFAHFKGRYLRAQRSFVNTHGHSVAEISVAQHQSNWATDASDIYYYNLPTTRADFMSYDGSVLDMREWNQHHLRDFDRYNKQFP